MGTRQPDEAAPEGAGGAKLFMLHADHPLVGTWVVANDGSSIEFKIGASARGFTVSARDSHDGAEYVVDNGRWDGAALRFNLWVPSNGTRVELRIRLREDGTLEDNFTAQYVDVLVRKDAISDHGQSC